MSHQETTPHFNHIEAADIAQQLYHLSGQVDSLPSERDQNFRLITPTGATYILKIANQAEDLAFLKCQNRILAHLKKKGLADYVPRLIVGSNRKQINAVQDATGQTFFVRLLTYLPGKPLAQCQPHSPALLTQLGRFMGNLDAALLDFDHPAAKRNFHWDLKNAEAIIKQHRSLLTNPKDKQLIDHFLNQYQQQAVPHLQSLRTSVIHSDGNDYNVLVSLDQNQNQTIASPQISGLIDFGDLVYSYTVAELAITAAYAMLNKPDPLAAAAQVVGGYHPALPLTETELQVLYAFICLRLCTSVALAAYQQQQSPDNDYLSISEQPAWHLLRQLQQIPANLAHYIFRDACGLPPCPQNKQVVEWLKAHPAQTLIDVDLQTDPGLVFDLSVGSLTLGQWQNRDDTAEFTKLLFNEMAATDVQVGIGRYDEARQIYTSDLFQSDNGASKERRTVHLGLDLFMSAGSPVYAPYDGRIHSFQHNAAHLDYGPTIILEHTFEAGSIRFYTLYGHLSFDSLDCLREGQRVKAGELFARIGDYPLNGNWPPHLHFQIIVDLLGRSGEFPGVALPSQRSVWLSLCPDPNLALKIPQANFPTPSLNRGAILEKREQKLGKMLSVAYKQPLKIVRGSGQYLYDDMGRAYLDCVNNVCHVGHCHSQVVKAGQTQMAVLNTNTRYLHDNLVEYAERLTATLPEPLNVCFFVCSGSEANELALRLAKTYTQQQNMLIVEGAYHGNTQALVDISPYKFEGPGGAGLTPHIHKVIMPDPYRGPYKGYNTKTGQQYATHVQQAIAKIQGQGQGLAGFICESVLGCGGQIVLPNGYLAAAFQHVRKAGGLCIVDEVQVGFGRVGSHFWAFETQGVVPDIVTMGKPIGNGHPLAAVVTTAEIADSFNNGMEYFNTFGGNPVSCAIGLAVLDVIEQEALQANALAVGRYLLQRLNLLKENSPLIGDVRGLGLFIGVELVLDRETLEPAPHQAAYIIERMKEEGILLSTDGPLHNVLKFKPPLVFSQENADQFVDTLAHILTDWELSRQNWGRVAKTTMPPHTTV